MLNTCPQLVNKIEVKKTLHLGHIKRYDVYEQLQIIIEGKVDGKRSIGRKKK